MSDTDARQEPIMVGRFTRLAEIEAVDEEWIGQALAEPGVALTWRPGGLALRGARMVHAVSAGVQVAMLVRRKQTDERVALVQLFNVNTADRHGYLSVAVASEYQRSGWPLEGVALFLDYVFCCFPLRKIYIEQSAAVGERVEGLRRVLSEEGVLREHEFRFGRLNDVHIFACYREFWKETIRARMWIASS
jgi:hypothetical protein